MFEEEPVLVESIYPVPTTVEVTPRQAAPDRTVFPYSNVRLIGSEATAVIRNEHVTIESSTAPTVSEEPLIIGGVKQDSLYIERTDARTEHVRKLSIAGTVSHEAHLRKVESRKALPRRLLARALGWLSVRHSLLTQEPKQEVTAAPENTLEDLAA